MSNSVAIFLPSLKMGGAERATANLAEGFTHKGINVSLVLASAEGPYLAELSEHIRVVDLGSTRTLRSLLPLARYIRESSPDVLLSAMDHANLVSLVAARLAGVDTKAIITVHKMKSQTSRLDSAPRREILIPTLARWLYPQAHEIIAVSNATALDLSLRCGLPIDEIKVIPNAVVTPNLHQLATQEVEHPVITSDTPLILGVGRLGPEKNFATLIRAFSRVVKVRDSRLVILGDGPQRGHLMQVASDCGLDGMFDLP